MLTTLYFLFVSSFLSHEFEAVVGFPHENQHQHHRSTRNLGQLVALLVKDTPYTFYKMSSYGNWCGRGMELECD
jgi:hypothetical protein